MAFKDEMKALSNELCDSRDKSRASWYDIPEKIPKEIRSKIVMSVYEDVKRQMRESVSELDFSFREINIHKYSWEYAPGEKKPREYYYNVTFVFKYKLVEDPKELLSYAASSDAVNYDGLVVMKKKIEQGVSVTLYVRKKEYCYDALMSLYVLFYRTGFKFYDENLERDKIIKELEQYGLNSLTLNLNLPCDSTGRVL